MKIKSTLYMYLILGKFVCPNNVEVVPAFV